MTRTKHVPCQRRDVAAKRLNSGDESSREGDAAVERDPAGRDVRTSCSRRSADL